jgi:hypothetical protein
MSSSHSAAHGRSSAAPRLVQRAVGSSSGRRKKSEHRASKFVVAGPGSSHEGGSGADLAAEAFVSGGSGSERRRHSPRGGRSAAGGIDLMAWHEQSRGRDATEAVEAAPEDTEDSRWGQSRRREEPAPGPQCSDRGGGVEAAAYGGDAVAARHETTHHRGAAGGGGAAGGLMWGARIDDRLDRVERLLELATGGHHDIEEKLASVVRRCSDQREELEELRFEVRRKPPPEAAPPPPSERLQSALTDTGPDVLVLAGQLHALQQQCDALGPKMGEMLAATAASQRHDIADKVGRAVSKESKRMRLELSGPSTSRYFPFL